MCLEKSRPFTGIVHEVDGTRFGFVAIIFVGGVKVTRKAASIEVSLVFGTIHGWGALGYIVRGCAIIYGDQIAIVSPGRRTFESFC